MDKLSDARAHFETKEIQGMIRKNISCATLTNNREKCRPSLTTNRFKDLKNDTDIRCNWYCLRKCSPRQLMPLLTKLPKVAITNHGTEMKITGIELEFNAERPTASVNLRYEDGWWSYTLWGHEWGWGVRSPQVASPEELANKLCQWFSKSTDSTVIDVSAKILLPREYSRLVTDEFDDEKFDRFDSPYLTPSVDWKTDIDYDDNLVLKTEFTVR